MDVFTTFFLHLLTFIFIRIISEYKNNWKLLIININFHQTHCIVEYNMGWENWSLISNYGDDKPKEKSPFTWYSVQSIMKIADIQMTIANGGVGSLTTIYIKPIKPAVECINNLQVIIDGAEYLVYY